jgi:hypothetical protein
MKVMFVLMILFYSPGGYGADGLTVVRIGTYEKYSQCASQAKHWTTERARGYCIPVNGP